jgi:phosphopantothenate synthetase
MSDKTPMKSEKRNVHVMIDPSVYRLAKVECAKIDVDLSYATEQLYRLWASGKAMVKKEL